MQKQVYLDYSASTPTDERVVEAMMPYFSEVFGNPSSPHGYGRKAEQAVEDARESIARVLHCKPNEVIFTSGGSESDNLAIRGIAMKAKQNGKQGALITSPIEHSAVSRTIKDLHQVYGFEMAQVAVDSKGVVDTSHFEALLSHPTTLVSVMYANNEIGTLQDITLLAKMTKQQGAYFHTDAVQGAGQLPLNVDVLGVDAMSLSGHKFYAPKGVGVLYLREGVDLLPIQSGGSHEQGRRAGTLNTAFIVGMAKALTLAQEEQETRVAHYTQLRKQLVDGILAYVPNAILTGHPEQRLPSHASFIFDGIDGNQLVMHMDMRGVAASSASACKTGNPEPSDILLALGYSKEMALGSLRFSVGMPTTENDIERAVKATKEAVEALLTLKRMLT